MNKFKESIAQQISEISGVNMEEIISMLESPKNRENGDLALAIPKLKIEGNPRQLAEQYSNMVVPNDYIESVTSEGIFLNIRLHTELFNNLVLNKILEEREDYGKNNNGNCRNICIDYSSPNVAKPFHAGHLRSTIIGNFIKNLYNLNGYNSVGINFLGDWGKQYGLLAIGYEKFGNEEELIMDPINHLFKIYVEINKLSKDDPTIDDKAREYFKRMEDNDPNTMGLWKKFRDLSIVEYKRTYERLNVEFEWYTGESEYEKEMKNIIKLLEEKGLLEDSNGAKVVNLEKYKLGKVTIQKTDGTTLYITRDIASAIKRFELYEFDKSYYVVGAQQDLHFKQLFKILELMGYKWANKLIHINFGNVNGMSTRKGDVVFLNEILDQTRERMHEIMRRNEEKYARIVDPESTADTIGISAVVIQDMSAKRIKSYDFDWNRMFSFEGDTGPYIQFAHARIVSIIARMGYIDLNADLALLNEVCASDMISILSEYPDLVSICLNSLEPNHFVTYMFRLSQSISTCLEQLRVIGEPENVSHARIVLFWAAKTTLASVMRLVGLRPLDRI